jgi:hypothetical protein
MNGVRSGKERNGQESLKKEIQLDSVPTHALWLQLTREKRSAIVRAHFCGGSEANSPKIT